MAVVLDDAVAGVYTNLLLRIILAYFPDFILFGGE
jgi:hypothetical protein